MNELIIHNDSIDVELRKTADGYYFVYVGKGGALFSVQEKDIPGIIDAFRKVYEVIKKDRYKNGERNPSDVPF